MTHELVSHPCNASLGITQQHVAAAPLVHLSEVLCKEAVQLDRAAAQGSNKLFGPCCMSQT